MKTLNHLLMAAAAVVTFSLIQAVQGAQPLSARYSSKPWLSQSIGRTAEKLPPLAFEASVALRETTSKPWLVAPPISRQEIVGLRTSETSPRYVSSKPWLHPSQPKDVQLQVAPLK